MTYYSHTSGAPQAQTRGVSSTMRAEFDLIDSGFQLVATDTSNLSTELTNARQGQANLLANLGRYLNTFSAATGNLNMGAFRATNAANGTAPQDLTTLSQVQAMAFAAALPAVAGNLGKVPRVESGLVVAWDDWWGPVTTLTVANNNATLAVRTTYYLDSTGGAFGLNLPTMATGDWIKLIDIGGQLTSNNVTITTNGYAVRGDTGGLILDVSYDSLELVKSSSGVIEQ